MSPPDARQHRRDLNRDQPHRLCGVRAGQGQGPARAVPHRGIDLAAVRLPRRHAGGIRGAQPLPAQDPQAAVQFPPVPDRGAANARAGRADRVVVHALARTDPARIASAVSYSSATC